MISNHKPNVNLANYQGLIPSPIGGANIGEHVVFRGKNLHVDFHTSSWMYVYLYGVCATVFTPRQERILDKIFTYTSYPDIRIWNNRVAALAGSFRSSVYLGVAAALATSDAKIYGGGINARAALFINKVAHLVENGEDIAETIQKELHDNRSIAGFGRPISSKDERIEPLLNIIKEENLECTKYLNAVHKIQAWLDDNRYRLKANYAAFAVAIAMDVGLSPEQFYHYGFTSFLAGMMPCYIQEKSKTAGTLMPLRCDEIVYEGPELIKWSTPK